MTKKYSTSVDNEDGKAAKARGSNLRVHFKNSRETAKAIHGMSLHKAKSYLHDVMDHKRCIVFRRFCGGIGRTPLAKNEGSTNGQVRVQICETMLHVAVSAKAAVFCWALGPGPPWRRPVRLASVAVRAKAHS